MYWGDRSRRLRADGRSHIARLGLGLVRAVWGNNSNLVIKFVERLCLVTIYLVPPAASELFLREDSAVGTDVLDTRVVVTDVEHLTTCLWIRVETCRRGKVRHCKGGPMN